MYALQRVPKSAMFANPKRQGYDAGIMTVILADDQFNDYYNMNANRQGLVAIIPWAATALSQVWVRQRVLTDSPVS